VPEGFDSLLLPKLKRLEQALVGVPEPKRSRLRHEWWGELDGLPAVQTTLRSISPGAGSWS